MAFDGKRFLKTRFEPRTELVDVPDLAEYFEPGSRPVWKVRGLTGQELGWVNEAAERNRNVSDLVRRLFSESSAEKAEAIKELLGVSRNIPLDIARRIELLKLGSVDPECPEDLAVKLCEVRGIEFRVLTDRILELTGKGMMPGKSKPSGAKATSGPPSPLDTPGGGSSSN